MGASISRKQLLSFFIQASYLLDKFYSIKESFNFDSISEDSLEKILKWNEVIKILITWFLF